MPFDGIFAKCLTDELESILASSKIEKIYQPEKDEIVIMLRREKETFRLVASSSPNCPRVHITKEVKGNPSTPPMFCMFLRKHLVGGRILSFENTNFERIVECNIQAYNEMGDLENKKLLFEIMGRRSNIILLNSEGVILECVKRVNISENRYREILPGRKYLMPPPQDKENILTADIENIVNDILSSKEVCKKALLSRLKGFSPLLCNQMCSNASIDPDMPLQETQKDSLSQYLKLLKENIQQRNYNPCIVISDDKYRKPLDFHCFNIDSSAIVENYSSLNEVLDVYFRSNDLTNRAIQKTSNIEKSLKKHISRCEKKISIHTNTCSNLDKFEEYRLYGDLLTANIYSIKPNMDKITVNNYYTENNEEIEITLSPNLSGPKNAQKYYKKYNKGKSACVHAKKQIIEAKEELDYLENTLCLLNNSSSEDDINELRNELVSLGYVKVLKNNKKKKIKRKATTPLKYTSSDNFEILAGKTGIQNDNLTLKIASSRDLWLHVRNMPGSHVVIRLDNKELTDKTLFEAATIAAFNSKAKYSTKVPIDYTIIKHVHKPKGAKPGMVIYDNFETIIVDSNPELVKELTSLN